MNAVGQQVVLLVREGRNILPPSATGSESIVELGGPASFDLDGEAGGEVELDCEEAFFGGVEG
jgi:hypothetical protein